MKKYLLLVPLVVLLCSAFGCQKQSEAPIQMEEAEEATFGSKTNNLIRISVP
jgi:hypothetical protein